MKEKRKREREMGWIKKEGDMTGERKVVIDEVIEKKEKD